MKCLLQDPADCTSYSLLNDTCLSMLWFVIPAREHRWVLGEEPRCHFHYTCAAASWTDVTPLQRLYYKWTGSLWAPFKAREPHTRSGMARILLPHLRVLLVALLLTESPTVRANKGVTSPDEERDKESDAETPCEVKTVTVSTLPVLRENEFSFTGAAPGNVVGGGEGGGGGAAGAGGVGGAGTGGGAAGGGESRLLLFVRTDLPGRISVMDDLDNTALPYFTLGKDRFLLSPLHGEKQPAARTVCVLGVFTLSFSSVLAPWLCVHSLTASSSTNKQLNSLLFPHDVQTIPNYCSPLGCCLALVFISFSVSLVLPIFWLNTIMTWNFMHSQVWCPNQGIQFCPANMHEIGILVSFELITQHTCIAGGVS